MRFWNSAVRMLPLPPARTGKQISQEYIIVLLWTVSDASMICAPEAVFAGNCPSGRVLVFDDDHYYLGSAIAEHLAHTGHEVVLVTPSAEVSGWTHYTLE